MPLAGVPHDAVIALLTGAPGTDVVLGVQAPAERWSTEALRSTIRTVFLQCVRDERFGMAVGPNV